MNRMSLIALLLLSACSGMDGSKAMPEKPATGSQAENKVGPNGELISPDCPNWSSSNVTTFDNGTHSNFGCAITTNLGLMLEDPRDLERGASGGHVTPDPYRAPDVIKNYRNGLSVTVIGTPSAAPVNSTSGQ